MRKTLQAAAGRLSRTTLIVFGVIAAVGAVAAVAAVGGGSSSSAPAKSRSAARPGAAAAPLAPKRGPRGPRGFRGPRGLRGPAGSAGATGAQGPVGQAGAQGVQGIQGPIGPSNATEVVRATADVSTPVNTYFTLATISALPPGAYAIFAKAVLAAIGGDPLISSCQLVAGGIIDTSSSTAPFNGLIGGGPQATHNAQLTQTFAAAAPVSIQCRTNYPTWSASDITIIAIHLGSVTRTAVSS